MRDDDKKHTETRDNKLKNNYLRFKRKSYSQLWEKVGVCGRVWVLLIPLPHKPMNSVLGVYECSMDAKGRVLLPAGLKRQLDSAAHEGFVLKRSVFSPCLELHTMAQWRVISEKIGKLNRFVKKNADFVRLFHAGVKMVELDASGRILIAKDLAGFAGLERELVFSGTPFGVEIWSRSAYEAAVNPSDLDFAQLAEEVMGGQSGDHELP